MTCSRCDALREEVAYLKSELGLRRTASEVRALQAALNVRPQACRMLLMLYRARGLVVRGFQMQEEFGEDSSDPHNLVKTYACHLRKALGRNAIQTAWGEGYSLSASGRARVAEILGEAHAERAAA